MGWISVSAAGEMLSALPTWVFVWLLIGGIIYTLGAIVYATKIFNFKPGVFGFHEVWHIFVLLAAASHFIAVMGVAI
jgi:hemolysin III